MELEGAEKSVLIVDDDPDMVRSLEIYLRLAGLQVNCAFGGIGALQEMEYQTPSAVILDIMMPDIDGLELCRHIRGKLGNKSTPVIVLTALTDSVSRRKLMEAGATEYLTKPCDFAKIRRAVEQHTS